MPGLRLFMARFRSSACSTFRAIANFSSTLWCHSAEDDSFWEKFARQYPGGIHVLHSIHLDVMAELNRLSTANGGPLDSNVVAQAYRLAALDLEAAYREATKTQNIGFQKEVLSALLNFAPLVGNIKSAIEATSGKDYITNSDLSTLDRVFAGVGVVLPAAGKGLQEAYLLTKVGNETVAVALKASNLDDALRAASAGTTAANRVTAATVRETGILVAAKTTEELTLINTIVREGDQAGVLTERLTESVFKRSGYQSTNPDLLKYSGNKGLDSLFLKGDNLVVVVDSKQFSSGGVSLAVGNPVTNLEPQMTVEWVKQVAGRLSDSNDPAKIAVANQIFKAIDSGKLQLATSAVNKKTGQLVVVPLKR